MEYSTFADLEKEIKELWDQCPNSLLDLLNVIHDFRKEVMKIICKLPSASTVKDLPSYSGVYIWLDIEDKRVLYIGRSVNIKKRWSVRKYSDGFTPSKIQKVYWIRGNRQYFDIETLEQLLIFLFTPKYNRTADYYKSWFNFESHRKNKGKDAYFFLWP